MQNALVTLAEQDELIDGYGADLATLDSAKDRWARTSASERLALLDATRDCVMEVAEAWAATSSSGKGIDPSSPHVGEEWISGPFATLVAVDAFSLTLSELDEKRFIDGLATRTLSNGQLAVQVLPHSMWDHLLLSGVSAEVWMQKGIDDANLKEHAAVAYDVPVDERRGEVALVLGAGNIAAIPPTDVLYKLIVENQVVLLKMNPINDYLADILRAALRPFIDVDALRIVTGDARSGEYLCQHELVTQLHITGSEATHDAIVWGVGEEGAANKAAGTPRNTRRFTSELGSVSPAIVVPGPWTRADLKFQAENLATMKLHNAGHNCVATQAVIMPKGWELGEQLIAEFKAVAADCDREPWYPGTQERVEAFRDHGANVEVLERAGEAPALVIGQIDPGSPNASCEVFGPAVGFSELDAPDAESYLRAAISHANENFHGTLGASILIHPATIDDIGADRLESIVADLEYGAIGINAWSAFAFFLAPCPWGAFPGHSLDDIQSGIGIVHNSFMLERTERVVVQAPWRPFPRGLASGQLTLLPRPPFFITNRRQHVLGRLLTEFQHQPSWFKLPRLFVNALRG